MRKSMVTAGAAGFCFLLLILDGKTALAGAADGVRLCLQALIPSLFPFFVLSMVLTSSLMGQKLPFLSQLGRLCGMPGGSESLLAVGLLGGYPVGAQTVDAAYKAGQLPKTDAQRLLGFCSNAGPSFVFGIVAGKFGSIGAAWALWGIHILSALLTGMLLPGKSKDPAAVTPRKSINLGQALERSIKVMAAVCGWVILFRVVIAFFSRWILWIFPQWMQTLLVGLTELANGCCELEKIPQEGLRFVIASSMLSLGGLCVTMQTVSVTGNLGLGMYFPGKLLQFLISLALSGAVQVFCFPATEQVNPIPLVLFSAVSIWILRLLLKKPKKSVAFPGRLVYNREKEKREVCLCSFGSGSKNPAPTAGTAQS